MLAWQPDDPGISLLELLVNWLVCSGMELPVLVPIGSDAPAKLAKDTYSIRTSAQDLGVLLLPFSWSRAVIACENALRTLQRWSEVQVTPWPLKSKVRSLIHFGALQKSSGFCRRRPRLPMQAETTAAIIKGYAGGREFTLPRMWIQENNLPRVVQVAMLPEEVHEGRTTHRSRAKWRADRHVGA